VLQADAEKLNIEAAAIALAECFDYPWQHMPEAGRSDMRNKANIIIGAARKQGGAA
jgi:hypothetical protein